MLGHLIHKFCSSQGLDNQTSREVVKQASAARIWAATSPLRCKASTELRDFNPPYTINYTIDQHVDGYLKTALPLDANTNGRRLTSVLIIHTRCRTEPSTACMEGTRYQSHPAHPSHTEKMQKDALIAVPVEHFSRQIVCI